MGESILFMLNALGIGGSERKTVAVVNELHRSGHDVHLAYLDDRTPLLKMVGEDVPLVYLERTGKFSVSATNRLKSYLRANEISKIVCVSLYPALYAYAAVRLARLRKPPAFTIMVNATEHFDWKSRMQMVVYGPLLRSAERIVFGCQAQRRLWVDRYRLDEGKCSVVYNGIDWERFSPNAVSDADELPIDRRENDFVIGAVGTLWANKNHVELVRALARVKARLPNARLVIAGEGPERVRIEAAAKECGIADKVALLGEVYDIRPLLNAIDVFVLPSISETFSNAALEAMAMEKVVILSNVGGNPEMVENRVDGFCYELGDIDALSDLFVQLAADRDRLERIGRQARQSVQAKYSFSRMLAEYRDLLT